MKALRDDRSWCLVCSSKEALASGCRVDRELLAYRAHGDSEGLDLQITSLAEQLYGLGEYWLPGLGEYWLLLPASLLPPQSRTILSGAEMHSGPQAPRQRTLPDLLQPDSLLWLCVDAWDHAGIEEAR